MKSPNRKTSNPQIWREFCEKGLKSPHSSRPHRNKHKHGKNNKDDSVARGPQQEPSLVPVTLSHDAFTPTGDNPLTPVTPLDDDKWNSFQDSFDPVALAKSGLISVPTECKKCDCQFFKGQSVSGSPADSPADVEALPPIDPADPEKESLLPSTRTLTATASADDHQPLMSPNPCSCECHKCADFANMLFRKASLHKQDSTTSVSSDISSDISSRLTNSSSSSCSPEDDSTPQVAA